MFGLLSRKPRLTSRLVFLKGDGLQARSLRGTALTLISFGAGNFIRLASNLILTRLLFPEAFGLMALVQVVLTGLALFSDIGLHSSIIQDDRGKDPAFLNTAWTLQIVRGFLLWMSAVALATPMAAFYGEPMLAKILPVAGLNAFVASFNSTRIAEASRNMMLGRVTAMGLGCQLFSIVVMVLLAWWLQSVWALVFGTLVGAALSTVLSHLVLPGHSNRFQFEMAAAKRLIGFGKYIFLATIAGFLVNQGDRAILGKFVSLETLAIYGIALSMATIPILLAQALMNKIVFPLYAQIRSDEADTRRRKIRRARLLLTGGLIGLTACFALAGDWIIALLYDPRYHGAGPILVLAALSFLPAMITMSYPNYAMAAGHSGRYATIVITLALIQTTALYFGIVVFGVGGALVAPAIATILTYPVLIALIRPYRGWDPRHDAFYATVILPITALTLWLHGDIVAPLFAGL